MNEKKRCLKKNKPLNKRPLSKNKRPLNKGSLSKRKRFGAGSAPLPPPSKLDRTLDATKQLTGSIEAGAAGMEQIAGVGSQEVQQVYDVSGVLYEKYIRIYGRLVKETAIFRTSTNVVKLLEHYIKMGYDNPMKFQIMFGEETPINKTPEVHFNDLNSILDKIIQECDFSNQKPGKLQDPIELDDINVNVGNEFGKRRRKSPGRIKNRQDLRKTSSEEASLSKRQAYLTRRQKNAKTDDERNRIAKQKEDVDNRKLKVQEKRKELSKKQDNDHGGDPSKRHQREQEEFNKRKYQNTSEGKEQKEKDRKEMNDRQKQEQDNFKKKQESNSPSSDPASAARSASQNIRGAKNAAEATKRNMQSDSPDTTPGGTNRRKRKSSDSSPNSSPTDTSSPARKKSKNRSIFESVLESFEKIASVAQGISAVVQLVSAFTQIHGMVSSMIYMMETTVMERVRDALIKEILVNVPEKLVDRLNKYYESIKGDNCRSQIVINNNLTFLKFKKILESQYELAKGSEPYFKFKYEKAIVVNQS